MSLIIASTIIGDTCLSMAYDNWSIGIYSGGDPFRLEPDAGARNPVLTAADATDIDAQFVADPFMLCIGGVWYMFFEVFNQAAQKGEIGLAISHDGLKWAYQCIVLAEPFHLSYPCLAHFQNEIFLVPECYRSGAVRIYRATGFPFSWKFCGPLMEPGRADPTLFQHGNLWWMFAAEPNGRHDTLRLYFSRELFGRWTEHPLSPLVSANPGIARPAGKVLLNHGSVIRFAQDCSISYGLNVRAFEITLLTETGYAEGEHLPSPVLAGSGDGWNAAQMHHIDAHRISSRHWIACVDGLARL